MIYDNIRTICEKKNISIKQVERELGFSNSSMKDRAGHYQIKQVQPKYDTKPPALYLSLEKLMHPFKDGRDSGGN